MLLSMTFANRQVQAQEMNRAAVVVRFEDERTEGRCVLFEESEISGYALLQRSGLALDVKSEGQGGLVCAIDGTGCGTSNCLCQCQGDPCVYWSYWHMDGDGWNYSAIGSTIRRISDGDMDGWSWGPGSVTSAIEPPPFSFDDVCSSDTVIPESASPEPDTEPTEWLPYALLGLLLAAIAGGAVLASQRRSDS
jgi:hypothetical protein